MFYINSFFIDFLFILKIFDYKFDNKYEIIYIYYIKFYYYINFISQKKLIHTLYI